MNPKENFKAFRASSLNISAVNVGGGKPRYILFSYQERDFAQVSTLQTHSSISQNKLSIGLMDKRTLAHLLRTG